MKQPGHLSLSELPTPIIPLSRYFTDQNDYTVWMKRDDLSGLELSGNKVRKLDFLLREALDQQATHVITCGGMQSNHCRTTAFYCARLGLKCTLVLRGEKPGVTTGNYFLDTLTGCRTVFVTPEEYAQADTLMQRLAEESPEKSYVIPEGGSNALGAWGYVNCFREIDRQNKEMQLDIDTIVVATGSGGTHCGLLIGKLLSESRINVVSVNVCDDAGFFRAKIDTIISHFSAQFDVRLNWTKEDIIIYDGFVGEGYGAIGDEEVAVIRRLAGREGLLIDPVYGAKALRGLEENLRLQNIPGRNICFIHTGGVFGLFPYWERFAG